MIVGKASLMTVICRVVESIFAEYKLKRSNLRVASLVSNFLKLKPLLVKVIFSLLNDKTVFLVFLVKTLHSILVPSGTVISPVLVIIVLTFPK